jgi:hypothetical protein
LVLGIAAVPVLVYAAGVAYGTIAGARDDEHWEELRTAAVLEYGSRTDSEISAAGDSWRWAGAWTLPLPEGLAVIGVKDRDQGAELVLRSTDLNAERCLLLAFDDDGLRVDNDISCAAYRASPG